MAWKLNVDAHAVGEQAEPADERVVRAGNGLDMYIAAEPVFAAQQRERFNQPFTGIVGIFEDTGRKEQPFNIVAAVELDRQLCKLTRGKAALRVSLLRRFTQYLQS